MMKETERRQIAAEDMALGVNTGFDSMAVGHISPVYSMIERRKKPKAPKPYKVPEYCLKCIYRHPLYTTGAAKAGKQSRVCCFSADSATGELRGCPAGEGCTRRVIKSERRTA